MAAIDIHLYEDWLRTVKSIFAGSGQPLPEHLEDHQVALAYFLQTAQDEKEAREQAEANERRLNALQQMIEENFEQVIEPDIRQRTGYTEQTYRFEWVYQQGEHIVERNSSYRIPLE